MTGRKLQYWVVAAIVVAAGANLAWALGFQLGQSPEELELKYDVDCAVHKSGRVTVNLTVAEQGRIKPIHDIQLAIPGNDGSGHFDLSLSMATENVDGKLRARAHLSRELADRATIRLLTLTNPKTGKQSPRTWYFHLIPIADHITDDEPKAD